MPDDDDVWPRLFAVMKRHSVWSGHANGGVFSAVSAAGCDGEVSCYQACMRLLVVVVAMMTADTVVGGDETTLSAELSCQGLSMK
jgi:hypothetical protein